MGYAGDIDECPYDFDNDLDDDGVCDNLDDCIGYFDECNICNGPGILDGDCDCDGNILDDCGTCGGTDFFNESGGLLDDDSCDCFGSILDCNGDCAGNALEDVCGVGDDNVENDNGMFLSFNNRYSRYSK